MMALIVTISTISSISRETEKVSSIRAISRIWAVESHPLIPSGPEVGCTSLADTWNSSAARSRTRSAVSVISTFFLSLDHQFSGSNTQSTVYRKDRSRGQIYGIRGNITDKIGDLGGQRRGAPCG